MYFLAQGKGCLVPSEHGWLSLQYLLNMSVTWASDVWSWDPSGYGFLTTC